ncbi:CDP-alcohol phosphatidyltransferase family protein [Halegenticoccus tardaugens]|uniref:CDP-alcohol phosphatidyltransferase family protein n=1 Tax=Halegenticoccus tardaugens TaxID=2071624 RepID=UPI00100C299F|nr:CDP-alcohol phosphatidyltransferase family protein [Halegenticoccus tardaugens]
MTDELRSTIRGVRERIDAGANRRRVRSADRTDILRRLTPADYLSLAALFVAWVSALLFLSGEPNWAVIVMFGAFAFDKLDGYYARKLGVESRFGRGIDSFIDVFAYLVTGALLFHYALSPHIVASAVVGFAVLAFGGLRLVRHNSEGFGDDGGTSYYHGTTVVHTNVVVVANYLLSAFVGVWNGWVAAATILLVCPLMVSDYKAYKTAGGHFLAGVLAVVASGLCLLIEYGYV